MALYSLDEVFQMAAQMEESGREFYEAVAKHSPNELAGTLCRHLAAEEQKHFQTFQALRKRLGSAKAPRVSMEQVGTTELPLVSREATIHFRDLEESLNVLVDPTIILREYQSPYIGAEAQVYELVIDIATKVEVVNRSTGETFRLSRVNVPFTPPSTTERINEAITRGLSFPSKRLWLSGSHITIKPI